ncbi:hypothetical protein [Erysipelothrix tonsillarum]|uniref:hypothetical protein n=1 Tax=Erysipelothrix tonsillarum TaxID=38402 RepID=UPI0039C7F565
MTTKWKQTENAIFNEISEKYSNSDVEFTPCGDSDSTQSDIFVEKTNGTNFYIEIKSDNSQAAQFVITQDKDNSWVFSPRNKSTETKSATSIITSINNKSIENFSTARTDLVIDSNIIFQWIIDFYKEKNVEFFASKYNNELIIVPLEKISDYFSVSGGTRNKGSGSGEVSDSYWDIIKSFPIFEKVDSNVKNSKGKRYLTFSEIPKHLNESVSTKDSKTKIEETFNNKLYRFQLEYIDNNKFYIRKLSTTSNATVIFTLDTNSKQNDSDLNLFIKRLKNQE